MDYGLLDAMSFSCSIDITNVELLGVSMDYGLLDAMSCTCSIDITYVELLGVSMDYGLIDAMSAQAPVIEVDLFLLWLTQQVSQ